MTKGKPGGFREKMQAHSQHRQEHGASYGYLSLPKGVSVFQVEKYPGTTYFDILPYEVTDTKHGDRVDASGVAMPGTFWWRKPFKIHRNIGSDKDSYVCLSTWGAKCPICEEMLALRAKKGEDHKEEIKALKPSYRSLFVVIPQDETTKKEDKVPHIFDMSDFLFYDPLYTDITEDEEWEFMDFEVGKIIKTSWTKESFAGNDYPKASRCKFIKRGAPYDESILKSIPNLDNVLQRLTYEQLLAKFMGLDDEDIKVNSRDLRSKNDDESGDTRTRKSFGTAAPTKKAPEIETPANLESIPEDIVPLISREELDDMGWKELRRFVRDLDETNVNLDNYETEDQIEELREALAEEMGIGFGGQAAEETTEAIPEMTWEEISAMAGSKLIKLVEDTPYLLDRINVDDYADSTPDLRKAIAKVLDIVIPVVKSTPATNTPKPITGGKATASKPAAASPVKPAVQASVAKTTPATNGNKCPHGHVFGVDTEKHDVCDSCDFWNDCIDARDSKK